MGWRMRPCCHGGGLRRIEHGERTASEVLVIALCPDFARLFAFLVRLRYRASKPADMIHSSTDLVAAGEGGGTHEFTI